VTRWLADRPKLRDILGSHGGDAADSKIYNISRHIKVLFTN